MFHSNRLQIYLQERITTILRPKIRNKDFESSKAKRGYSLCLVLLDTVAPLLSQIHPKSQNIPFSPKCRRSYTKETLIHISFWTPCWKGQPGPSSLRLQTYARELWQEVFVFLLFFCFFCVFVCLFVSCDDDFSTNFVVVFCPMEELELVKTRLCALNHRTIFLPEERKQVWANLALKCG